MKLVEHEQAEGRKVSAALAIGILLMPLVFVWFTLRKGHSTLSRVLSFVWLAVGFVLVFALNASERAERYSDPWEGKLSMDVQMNGGDCKEPTPIATTITNDSDVDVLRYGWWISVKAKGHSTELSLDQNSTSDYILKPGEGATFCEPVPQMQANNYQRSELEFTPGHIFVKEPERP